MKTTIIRSIALTLTAIVMALQPFAQKANSKNDNQREVSYYVNEKTFGNNNSITLPSNVPYNQKVFQEFDKIFLDANHVNWSIAPNGTYHAYFRKDGALNAVLFNKNGKIVYLINYLSEKELPSEIQKLVADDYEEYKITSVTKVLQSNREIWIIKITGINHIITLREEDGELQEMEKVRKAN
jgi:hypothetical protein